VQIHGNMSKHVYPVGMARGANATFHRVLMTWYALHYKFICFSNEKLGHKVTLHVTCIRG